MYVVQCYDSKGKNLGKYAGQDYDGMIMVNRSVLCSYRYLDKQTAEKAQKALTNWGKGEGFSFKVTKVKA